MIRIRNGDQGCAWGNRWASSQPRVLIRRARGFETAAAQAVDRFGRALDPHIERENNVSRLRTKRDIRFMFQSWRNGRVTIQHFWALATMANIDRSEVRAGPIRADSGRAADDES
jgi:hypothetical protein